MAATKDVSNEELPTVPRDGFGSESEVEIFGEGKGNQHGSGAKVGGVEKSELAEAIAEGVRRVMEEMGMGKGAKGSDDGGGAGNVETEGKWTQEQWNEWNKWKENDWGIFWEGGENERGMILDGKHFRDVDKYEGIEGTWTGWIFNVLTQVGGISTKCSRAMEKILEKNMKVPTEELVEKELGAGMVQEFGAEVFRTLCM